MPIRTRSGTVGGQVSACKRRWASNAATMAAPGARNAAENASPAVENT